MRRRPEVDNKTAKKSGAENPAEFKTATFDLASLDLVEALYETLPDPVLITNSDGAICFSNESAEVAFGYAGAELAGMDVSELFKPFETERSLIADMAQHRMVGGKRGCEMECRRKDGSRFVGTLTSNRVKNKHGESVAQVYLVHDLSEFDAVQADKLHLLHVLSEALAFIKEGFVIYDDEDRLVICNDAYRSFYATSAEVLVPGNTFEDIMRHGVSLGQYPEAGESDESREAWLAARMQAHKEPNGVIVQGIDGNRWLQIEERVTPENYRVGVRTEITALLQMNSQSERLGRILEAISEEIYLIDPETLEVRLTNKMARGMRGVNAGDNLALRFDSFNRPADGTDIRDKIAPLVSMAKNRIAYQGIQTRSDGETYPCHVRIESYRDNEGPAFIVSVEDISKLLEIEALLMRSEKEFESLVCQLPDAITRAKPDTTLVYINPFYSEFMGTAPEDLIGKKFEFMIPEDERDAAMAHIRGLTPENPMNTFEQLNYSHDGRSFIFLWSNLMVFEDGEPVELVSIGRDISEQRQAQDQIARQSQELQRQNYALEQFTGIVSHDLKAPLRQVRSFAELISEDLAAGDMARLAIYSKHLTEKTSRLERLVSRLLAFSKEAYRSLDCQHFELVDAIELARANLTKEIAETGAQIEIDASISIRADFGLIVQLLQNLLANAMKYTTPGVPPVIRIEAETLSGICQLMVADNGIGIEPSHGEDIFEAFYRLHHDESSYEGAGLGLALCKRIAESHLGEIRLDPDYTAGSRFIVTLPDQEPRT